VEIGVEARHRLHRAGYLALRDIACDADGDALRLRGRLPTYYLKQLAQELAAEVEGVGRVINQIQVSAPAGRPPTGRDRASRPGAQSGARRDHP
jgi:osmotically-inducible protein OsmY